jgi:hypothetical protein
MNPSKTTYDYSRCSRATLEKLASLTECLPLEGPYVDAVRAEARVKTLAEYDAEIGALLREKLNRRGLDEDDFATLEHLVNASRGLK